MSSDIRWEVDNPKRMSVQLDRWAGEFGDEYTARNVVDWRDRIGAWWTMLKGLELESVSEIGCNTGHNLVAITRLAPALWTAGVEPNEESAVIAKATKCVNELAPRLGNAGEAIHRTYDLVFTCGVLIHVPPDELDATMRRIHALSRKYILCIEYFAEQETMVPYRGLPDMLWKRNWQQEYESRFPDLKLIRSGFWGKDSGFDDCHWWMWEKA